jgi:plastocyanin
LVLGAIVLSSVSARANTFTVEIKNTAYVPADRTIARGDTVSWVNRDNTAHTVTFDDGSFDSSPSCVPLTGVNCLGPGQSSAPHTFNETGTFTYHCRVHNTMTGALTVEAPVTSTTSTTVATTTTSPSSTTTSSSDEPTVTQASLPSPPSTSHVALPKSINNARHEDDMRAWTLAAVAIAGATTIAGIVLVRRGRVPFG